jgi:hypothetical protein
MESDTPNTTINGPRTKFLRCGHEFELNSINQIDPIRCPKCASQTRRSSERLRMNDKRTPQTTVERSWIERAARSLSGSGWFVRADHRNGKLVVSPGFAETAPPKNWQGYPVEWDR